VKGYAGGPSAQPFSGWISPAAGGWLDYRTFAMVVCWWYSVTKVTAFCTTNQYDQLIFHQ
jgi:hypothetical protein